MNFIARASLIVLFAGIALVSDGIWGQTARAVASAPVVVAATQTTTATAPPVTYAYVAQAGDSYTAIARKATQTYGKKFNVQLSLAQIVYTETQLTQAAGSPYLNLGEAVTISEATIKSWVEKAQQLSADEQAAWQYYVPLIDFNTDAVGVASH